MIIPRIKELAIIAESRNESHIITAATRAENIEIRDMLLLLAKLAPDIFWWESKKISQEESR